MTHEDDKILILRNSFDDIKALAVDYAIAEDFFEGPDEAIEAISLVADFVGLLGFFEKGDGSTLMGSSYADILVNSKIVRFVPPEGNKWYDSTPEIELAMELDLLFRGLTNGLDDGLTDVLRV